MIWEVASFIRFKDIPRMFHRLVHEPNTTNLEVELIYIRGDIVSLTKRLIRERVKVIPKYLVRVYSEEGSTIVESEEEFRWVLEACNPGDIIELRNFSCPGRSFILNTSNVTICFKVPDIMIMDSLYINGDKCTIKSLQLGELSVSGSDNVIAHCQSNTLSLKGGKNEVMECSFGGRFHSKVEIVGNNNVIKKCLFKCPAKAVRVHGSNNKFLSVNYVSPKHGLIGI